MPIYQPSYDIPSPLPRGLGDDIDAYNTGDAMAAAIMKLRQDILEHPEDYILVEEVPETELERAERIGCGQYHEMQDAMAERGAT
jgi:hypothetical protein